MRKKKASGAAIIIKMVHVLVLLFIVLTPFTNNEILISYNFIFILGMWMHWMMNSNVCVLSEIEYRLTGIKYNEGFINNVLTPIFELPKNSNVYITYGITGILFIVDCVKLYRADFKLFKASYQIIKAAFMKLYAKIRVLIGGTGQML